MLPGLLMLSMIIVSTPALALYKCETQGKVLYADRPCGANQSELPPAPPGADPAGARRLAQEEKKQLASFEKEADQDRKNRRQRNLAQDKSAMANKKKCTLLGLEKKWSAEDAATSSHLVSEKSEKLKRVARRKAERFDAECKLN